MVLVVVGMGCCWKPSAGEAAEPKVSVSLLPVRYVAVEGDHDKFQAHHWTPQGYTGGVENLSLAYTFPDGTEFSAESHALIDQNDLGTDVFLSKEGLGFISFDYAEFRKYYDPTGGVYYRFQRFPSNDTLKDLALDIGTFGVETGLTLEGMPELTLGYEREFKDGAKSRLSWTAVTEGSTTRNIGPSWQDVDEIVDTFAVTADHDMGGFVVKGEQRWELVRSELFREEKSLATTGAAAETKIRRQDQAPESTLMTTLLKGERWFLSEKAFFASAYRFAHMNNREFESLNEFNENGVATNFPNPKQQVNARADNDYDTHTWVGTLTGSPWSWLSLGTKLKSEVIKKDSNSSYPADTGGTAPNGVIDRVDVSLNNTKAVRWGEGVSVRFFGIPRAALYTELELEQSRVLLREDRKSLDGPDTGNGSSAGEVFNRETVTDVRRGAWTVGGRFDPWPFLDLTTHVRRRVNDNDYDDQRESAAAATALSAFIDEQNQHTNEFTIRTTLRPCRWFRSSFRYQFRDDDYSTRFEAQDTVKTGMQSHVYTSDVTVQPLRTLLTTASFSRQDASTTTPARLASSANTPTFNADVSTWMLSADYAPTSTLSWNSTVLYSWASNFNDFTATGLPLGADVTRLDATTGFTWSVREDTSVKAEYGLYSYLPNSVAESGNYHAHVIWLEVSQAF